MEEQMLLLDKRTQAMVESYIPSGDTLEGLVCFFSVFADGTRLRILSALAVTELCVTDLARLLRIHQDDSFAPAAPAQKPRHGARQPLRQGHLLQSARRYRQRRPVQGGRISGLLSAAPAFRGLFVRAGGCAKTKGGGCRSFFAHFIAKTAGVVYNKNGSLAPRPQRPRPALTCYE